MKMKKQIPALVLALASLLTGCATGYHAMSDTGGYEQSQIDENTYSIRFHGNGYTETYLVRLYAKFRAAEIGKQLNYKYVALLGQQDQSVSSTYSTPVTTQTYGTVNSFGGTANYYGTSTSYGGTQTYNKPRIELIARYFEEKPQGKYLEVYEVDALYEKITNDLGFNPATQQ